MTAGMIPSRTSVKPNTASGQATAMSAQATSPEPPPRANPWTQQTTGSGTGVDRLEHAVETHRIGDVLLVGQVDRRALPLDVGAGAERRPVAFEQHGSRIADVREGLRELGDERRVEGVAALGLRERHAEEVSVPLDPQRRHLRGA